MKYGGEKKNVAENREKPIIRKHTTNKNTPMSIGLLYINEILLKMFEFFF